MLEGRARDVPAPEGAAGLRLVRATGSGDDALAELVPPGSARPGRDVVVVTADRGLRARLPGGGGASPGRAG